MVARLQDKKADLLKGVAGRLHDKLPDAQAAMAEVFLGHYYRAVPPGELIERDPLDLYGAALAHLRFAERRKPGEAIHGDQRGGHREQHRLAAREEPEAAARARDRHCGCGTMRR